MPKFIRNLLYIRNSRGQSMVELAFVLPVLILVICGIVDFGWIYGNQLMVSNASREGARYAATVVMASDYTTRVVNRVKSVMPDYAKNIATITVSKTNNSFPRDGDVLVLVRYTFDLMTPVTATLFGNTKYTVKAQCQMKAE